jgi:hypothetical protein
MLELDEVTTACVHIPSSREWLGMVWVLPVLVNVESDAGTLHTNKWNQTFNGKCFGEPSLPHPTTASECNMSDQSGSSHFQVLFESALQDYERQTGITLAKHPLAEQLQTCQSIGSVTTLLQEQARAFNKFRGNDKTIKSIESAVSALSRVSATASLGQAIGMVRPSGRRSFTRL